MAKFMTKDLFPLLNHCAFMAINGYDVEATYPEGTEGAWVVKPDSDDFRSIIQNQEVTVCDTGDVGEIAMIDAKGQAVIITVAQRVNVTLADLMSYRKPGEGFSDNMLRSLQNLG
jgi:hypothetical protein